uniref:B box-type domain-containing protein n=1 Tax=Salix viminalis TaxID=40686 RepID=A0A6N2MGB0_SALVM
MKIRCDVCDNAEATVFCCADEAALCHGCDHRVHHANKLARKHSRFSLVPSFLQRTLLFERRALLFCQEDRAILCRECDLSIHKANEHTQKHSRFLLTGVKLSASSSLHTASSTTTNNFDASINTNRNHQPRLEKPSSASNEIFSSPSVETASATTAYSFDDNHVSDNGSISTSSISEYLETVPGWRIDDLLDPSFSSNNGCNKVPQVTSQFPQLPRYIPQPGSPFGFDVSKDASKMEVSWKLSEDGFTVPQISPRSVKIQALSVEEMLHALSNSCSL